MKHKTTRAVSLALAASMTFGQAAQAFCGFYVATTDSPLINKASRVVLAHDGNTTQVTMASDVAGDPTQFGLVIPVPTVIKKGQVKIVDSKVVQHLADYTKPRLVQYHDADPCEPPRVYATAMPAPTAAAAPGSMSRCACSRASAPPSAAASLPSCPRCRSAPANGPRPPWPWSP